jgi:metallo-beta-lactamase family protein
MAVRATKVFMEHAKDLEDMDDGSPFEMPNFHFVETVDQSNAVNMIKAGAIILSASGMCEAGRIRHHLKHNLWRPIQYYSSAIRRQTLGQLVRREGDRMQ